MQSSRDSSLWRSLAVALGDGLAFVVGMKLTQAASRQLSAARLSAPPCSDLKRVERNECAPVTGSDAVRQQVLEAIVKALEERLAEHSGEAQRRLAEVEARFAIELRSLDQRDHAIVKGVSDDIAALRQQMVVVHQEFAGAIARIVAVQVSSQVRARAAAFEQSITARIAAAVEAAIPAAIDSRLPAAMSAVVAPLEQELRAEVEQKDREIAELRQRLADTDTKVSELIQGIGQICRQASEKIAPPVSRPERESTHRQSPNPAINTVAGSPAGGAAEVTRPPDMRENGIGLESQDNYPAPGPAQAQNPGRLWRVPLVSSVVIATSGLVLKQVL